VFDLRYHVASLAAVFVALIVGILVGVGLAGSGVTKEADLRVAREQRDIARALADSRLKRIDDLGKTADTYESAFDLAYPEIMSGLLKGRRIAVLFVGSEDSGLNQAIDRTLADAGAAPAVRVMSLSVPVDGHGLDRALAGKGPQFARYLGDDDLDRLGEALGTEFQSGGPTPLWKLLGGHLIGQISGNTRQPADGVVVVRTVDPQQGDTARFLRGLYTGLASTGVPAVGVEESGRTPSATPVYRDRGLSSVDDVDLTTGRVALALLLDGARPGHYGIADGADAILPTLPSG
jgi:hypothetical protein